MKSAAARLPDHNRWKRFRRRAAKPRLDEMVDLRLFYPQGKALLTPAREILFGGAAGGGKSHLLRVAAIFFAWEIPGLQVYLFRRTYPEIRQNHMEGPTSFPNMLAPLVARGLCSINEGRYDIEFPSRNSSIFLRHCQHAKNVTAYQGAEIHFLLFDELTHFSAPIYRYLRSRVRGTEALDIPERWGGMFPRILSGSNPGGVGHHWVKAAFVEPDPRGSKGPWQAAKEEGGMLRQFIPARLEDNPALDAEEYEGKLYGLGDEALVRAMREGDWDIVAGAFFGDVWTEKTKPNIVLRPFQIPPSWPRFRSFDWGSSRPASIGWWAEAPGGVVKMADGTEKYLHRGSLIRYREHYFAAIDVTGAVQPDVGQKLTNHELGAEIAKMSRGETYEGDVADPSIFTQQGGPSIHDQMMEGAEAEGESLYFRPADNSRIPGWQVLRAMLREAGKARPEHPGMYVFDTCVQWLRTVPSIPRDDRDSDDVNTDAEDHVADETRYAAMSGGRATDARVPLGIGG